MRTVNTTLLFFLVISFSTCFYNTSRPNNETLIADNNSDSISEKENNRSIDNKTSSNKEVYCFDYKGSLPFGCQGLLELPDTIEIDFDNNNKKALYDKYINISQFYQLLNNKSTIASPLIKKIENINVGNYFPFDSNTIFIDSIRYRLPDLGPYQCFYSHSDLFEQRALSYKRSKESEEAKFAWSKEIHVDIIGNLILYDPASNIAKVINIYYSTNTLEEDDEVSTLFSREFYFEKDKTIKVYTITSNYDYITTKIDFSVNVLKDGLILIKDSSGKIIKTYER